MNIIIIGCGKVGFSIAEQLNNEGHNLTIIDQNESELNDAALKLDVMGVNGNGALYETLEQAGVQSADILIAVTNSDELNMLVCLLAKQAGNLKTIARIRNVEYINEIKYFKDKLGIDLVLNPERMTAYEIIRLLRYPEAIEVESFSKDKIELIKMKLDAECPLCNTKLKDLNKIADMPILICVVERDQEVIIPTGETELKEGDLISFSAKPSDAAKFCRICKFGYIPNKSIMLVGGGKIAQYMMGFIEKPALLSKVKIIEKDEVQCQILSAKYPMSTIIHGNARNKELLIEEGIDSQDALITITGEDEENIILSLLAGKLTKARRITKVNHMNITDIQGLDVGSIVSPREISVERVLRFVRSEENSLGENFESLHKIAGGRAEAVEFIIEEGNPLTGKPIMDLKLKKNVLIGNILRDDHVINPGGSDMIKAGDHIIIITSNMNFKKVEDILE